MMLLPNYDCSPIFQFQNLHRCIVLPKRNKTQKCVLVIVFRLIDIRVFVKNKLKNTSFLKKILR